MGEEVVFRFMVSSLFASLIVQDSTCRLSVLAESD